MEVVVVSDPVCIPYMGYIAPNGYGMDYDPETKKTISAHRLAFKQAYGYLPKVVMHLCDYKQCVNPKHLQAGTQSENIKDCVAKGRYDYSKRKLNKEQVLEIYNDKSKSQRTLAASYGVTQRVVQGIKWGQTYKEYTGHGGSCGV
jgi:hypothetical protein